MHEIITTLLESITNHPWITLIIVVLLFHLERGHNLVRHILIPHYNFTRLMHVHVLTVSKEFMGIYQLSQSGIKNKQSTKKAIFSKNIELSLPLAELRLIAHGIDNYLLEKKLHDLVKRFLQKIESQYKYILLHEKCPSTLINPQELEQWVKDISSLVPTTFWESARSHFRINLYHFQRGKRPRHLSSLQDNPDSLFALSQALMLKMFFLPRSDVPQQAKMTVKNYIRAIEEAYSKKEEFRCVELFRSMQNFLRENKDILKIKKI